MGLRLSVVIIIIIVSVSSSQALMKPVPTRNSSSSSSSSSSNTDRSNRKHLHCSAVSPSNDVFKPLSRHANNTSSNSNSRRKRASTAQPIRITTVYDSSFYNLSNSSYIKLLVQQAVSNIQQALLVRRPATSPIALYRTCSTCTGNCPYNCLSPVKCFEVDVPAQYVQTCNVCGSDGKVKSTVGGPGANQTDYLLFVSALSSSRCSSSTVAYATFCNVDSYTWRPIAGMLNLCSITNSQGALQYDPGTTIHIIMHEMTHALGFISSLFPFYVDDSGNPLTNINPATGLPYTDKSGNYIWSSKVAVTNTVMWQTASGYVPVNKTYIVTPTVVNFVRQFFNCSTLVGGELEDQGGSGMAFSHWEKRIFVNEYMAGLVSEQMYVSALTLSLLQDTGWYYAVFSAAETYTWGQGLGCMFASESCLTWINAKVAAGDNPFPFCNSFDMWSNGETRTTCDPKQQSVRVCNLATYGSLDSLYSYFSQTIANAPNTAFPSLYGGLVYAADYCPYYQDVMLTYSKNQIQYSTCNNVYYNPLSTANYGLETYGVNSLCLRQASPNYLYQCSNWARSTRWGSGCYSVTCSGTSVTVTVNGQVLTCTSEQQTISWTPTIAQLNVSRYSYTPTLVTGTIVCPRCDNACPNQFCPMQRVPASSTSLLNTDQTSSSFTPASIPANIPCYSPTTKPSTTKCSCATNAYCVVVAATYYCVCMSGYYGNGVSCTAINTYYNVAIQTNVSLPIAASQSDVLNTNGTNFLLVKQQLENLFDTALSTVATYISGSATVQKVYSGSLIAQVSAVYGSANTMQSVEGPAYLAAMNTVLVNSLLNQGSNCTIGNFTSVNCSQAATASSSQNACTNSACPTGTSCSAIGQYQYVCVCPVGYQLALQSNTVQLQNCSFASTSSTSSGSSRNLRSDVLAVLLVTFAIANYYQSTIKLQ